MKRLVRLAAVAATLSVPAAAQILAHPGLAEKIHPMTSGHLWEPASAFMERGVAWCAKGSFVDASVLPGRKEIRLVCADFGSRGHTTQVLDADAKLLFAAPLASTDTADAIFQNVAWLERGKAAPLPVTWDFYRLRTWNDKGAVVDIPVKDGVAAVALLGSKEGGPAIVVGHMYGEKGFDAYRPDGKLLWSSADTTDVRELSVVRLGGRPALAALHAVSRLALLGTDGKVKERLLLGGNSDRVLLDDGKEPRLYAFDSGAGSKRESLNIFTAVRSKEGRRWESPSPVDLGPITITGRALGRFDAGKPPRLVVGTSNGWVFLLDAAGKPVASCKFRSPVRSLTAADLDGDGRDELVVVLDGESLNVTVFSPQTVP